MKKEIITSAENSFNESTNSAEIEDCFKIKIEAAKNWANRYLYRKCRKMKVKEVIALLEELSPLSYSEGFDNTGLLIGDVNATVSGILVTLDTLEKVVDEAIEKNCNLIVSFHPIIFSGLKKLLEKPMWNAWCKKP